MRLKSQLYEFANRTWRREAQIGTTRAAPCRCALGAITEENGSHKQRGYIEPA